MPQEPEDEVEVEEAEEEVYQQQQLLSQSHQMEVCEAYHQQYLTGHVP